MKRARDELSPTTVSGNNSDAGSAVGDSDNGTASTGATGSESRLYGVLGGMDEYSKRTKMNGGEAAPSPLSADAAVSTATMIQQQPQLQQQQQQQFQYQPQQQQQQQSAGVNQTNLFVLNLPLTMNNEGLKNLFSSYGQVESVKVMVYPQTQQSKGFAFVQFSHPDEARRAIAALHGKVTLGALPLQVKYALSNIDPHNANAPRSSSTHTFHQQQQQQHYHQQQANNNLYIKNIPQNVDKSQLERVFGQCGKVTESIILVDYTTKQSRGVGFCKYETPEEAQRALQDLNGRTDLFPGQMLPIELKYANEPKQKQSFNVGGQPRMFHQRQQRFGMGQQRQFPGTATGGFPGAMGGQPPNMAAYGMPGMTYPFAGYGAMLSPDQYALAAAYGYNPYGTSWPMTAPGMTGATTPMAAAGGVMPGAATGLNVMVYNLPENTDRHAVIGLLKTCGRIDNVHIMNDASGVKYATVTFNNPGSAAKAVTTVNGRNVSGKIISVTFV